MESKSVGFTGHRNIPEQEINKLKLSLKNRLTNAINKGYNKFYNGCAIGFDMLALETLVELKQVYDIKIVGVIPFAEQSAKYNDHDKARYTQLLSQCDEQVVTSTNYHKDCYKIRNQYIVDNADCIVTYWNGEFRSGTAQTIRMTQKQNKPVINLYK